MFIAESKGGHQRNVPISNVFRTVDEYLQVERPHSSTSDRAFVVLKGPRRGELATGAAVDVIVTGA